MNNRLLIGIAGLMVTLASNPLKSADSIPDSIVGTHIVDTEALRVRFSPNTSDRIAALLYAGDAVQLLDTADQWSHVAYDSNGQVRTGWTLSRLIVPITDADNDRPSNQTVSQAASIVAPVTQAPLEKPPRPTSFVSTHIVNTDALRVRITPDKYASTSTILKFGDEVQLKGTVDEWSRITYASNGVARGGWVLSNLIVEKSAVGQAPRRN